MNICKTSIYTFICIVVLLNIICASIGETGSGPVNRAQAGSPKEAIAQEHKANPTGAGKSETAYLELLEELKSLKGEQESTRLIAVLLKLGEIAKTEEKYQESVDYYRRALEIARKQNDKASEKKALSELIDIHGFTGEYKLAEESAKTLLEIAINDKDQAGQAECYEELGKIYLFTGPYSKAVEYYDSALELALKLDDKELRLRSLKGKSKAFIYSGEYSQAITVLEKAESAAKDLNQVQDQIEILIDMAHCLKEQGKYSQAANNLLSVLKLLEKDKNSKRTEYLALSSLGDLYAEWGMLDTALDFHTKAYESASAQGDKDGEAQCLIGLGEVLSQKGQYGEALKHLKKAKEIREQSKHPTQEIDRIIGETLLDMGQYGRARKYVRAGKSKASLARLYLIQRSYGRAEKIYRELLDQGEDTGDISRAFIGHMGLGRIKERRGKLKEAKSHYGEAVGITEKMRSSLLPAARRNFFSIKSGGFSRADAAKYLTQILMKQGLYTESLIPSELFRARSFADKIALGSDRGYSKVPDQVVKREIQYQSKIAALTKIRDCCPRKVNKDRYDNLTKKIEDIQGEFDKFIDQLRKDYPHYAAVKYPQPIDINDLELGDDQHILVYDILPDGLGIKLLKGKEVIYGKYYRRDMDRLEKSIKEFRRPFDYVELDAFDVNLAKKLYRRLLARVVKKIPEASRVVIVPDGSLALLPFEALVTGGRVKWKQAAWGKSPDGLKYFGDDHQVSYCQSLTVLGLTNGDTDKQRQTDRLLAFADPVFDEQDARYVKSESQQTRLAKAQGSGQENTSGGSEDIKTMDRGPGNSSIEFQRLEKTGELAKNLRDLFSGSSKVLSGVDAKKSALLDELGPKLNEYDYLVFATHGVYSMNLPGVMEPALILTLVPKGIDGYLKMTEVMSIDADADLVALTACKTALGAEVSGEGVMSIGRAFQFAGAKSVLISLWSVEETASVNLIREFFKGLKEGKCQTQALKEAQKYIRESGYDHPFFWSSFVLVGNTSCK